MKTILPWFITILTIFVFASCRQDNVSPIRNVRFDPKLLNPLKAAGPCTNYSYYTGSKLRNLGTLHASQLVVAFKGNMTDAQREKIISNYGFLTGILSQSASQSGMMYTLGLASGLNCAQVGQAIRELSNDKAIDYAGPYFSLDGNKAIGLSNEIMERTAAGGEATLKDLAANYNAKVIGQLGADTYLLRVDKSSRGNALELSNALKGQKGIAHATPDFILAL